MNREQKAATIEALVADIEGADAVFAVDYRGISVPQAAELRTKLREADATFRVVKNSLSERAADQAGVEALKALLQGPTALTFVRGDAALAAKAIADYGRITQLLPFKGGVMDGDTVDAEQIRAISRLPSRDVLYAQLVGVVASPVTGLVRTLSALVGGLAVALGQVREKKESGEIPAGEPPAGVAAATPAGDGLPQADEPSPGAEQAAAADAQAPAQDPPPAAGQPAPPPQEAPEAVPVPENSTESTSAAQTPPADASQRAHPDESPTHETAAAAAPTGSPREAEHDQTEPENAPAPDDNQADAPA